MFRRFSVKSPMSLLVNTVADAGSVPLKVRVVAESLTGTADQLVPADHRSGAPAVLPVSRLYVNVAACVTPAAIPIPTTAAAASRRPALLRRTLPMNLLRHPHGDHPSHE